MSDKTGIQWTDATWNPTTGCDRVSPGCDNCYALTLAARLKRMGSPRYQRDGDPRTSGPGFGVAMHTAALDQPLRWKRPRRIFVNSMSDLFHQDVPDEYIAKVFGVMAATPRHTYQVLTKRHARLRSLLNTYGWWTLVVAEAMGYEDQSGGEPRSPVQLADGRCALPNVWLGVSAEDQHWADIRIPALLETPAAVRFVSAEPLLGPITFRWAKWHQWRDSSHLDGLRQLDWVIIGGESGPGARRMDYSWAQDIVRGCQKAGVTPFVKQMGSVLGAEWGAGSHGADWDAWPADLRVREFPDPLTAAIPA